MTKISTYVVDEKVTALDKWIGSDANMQNRTKNFTPKKLAEYFNEDQVINIGAPLQYKYYTLDPLEARPNGTLTFETEIGPTVNFSAVTTFILSKYTMKQNIVSDFLNFLDGCKVLLFKSSDINSFGFYRISNIEPYEPDPNFFVVTVDYETGNGFMQEDNDYMLSLVSLPGGAIPTKTSELINDGDNGINPFISEVDINRTEWNAAYDGKINSAEVTGTTTKTLTLTKQDGSTIEASWTDDNTDAVTSVFGRTGDVTAQSGDYNTGQIIEVTNKKYQTDNQALFNDATSSIQTQLNSKQPSLGYTPVPNTRTITINGTSYDLSANRSWTIDTNSAVWGNISGMLSNQTDLQIALNAKVPYSGAAGNINLGEYGLTSGYYKFDLTPTGTPTSLGTMYWDSFYRTVSLIDGDGDTTLQIGQEERVLVHNNTGSTLTDGQVVYVTGSTGELPSVSLASNTSEATSSVTFGVVTETILNGADGFITTSGIIHGLNTLSYDEGSAIWLGSTPGTFTQTKPVAPLNSVLVGYVIKKSGGNGSIFVKIQNGYELEELHDVLISNVSGNEILAYEGSPTNLWKNKSVIDVLGFTPYNSTNPSNYISLTALSSTATGLSYNNTNGVFSLTSGYVIPTTTEESNWNTAYSNRITSASLPLSISSNSISISQATSTTNGYLSNVDWSTFNGKANDNAVVKLTGDQTISGVKTFSNPTIFNSSLNIASGAYSILYNPANSAYWQTYVDSSNVFNFGYNGNIVKASISNSGNFTANSFIKSGGTSSQFLKADGSIDSTTYQTALTNPVTGSLTTNYLPKATGPTNLGNSSFFDNGGIDSGITNASYSQFILKGNGTNDVGGGVLKFSNQTKDFAQITGETESASNGMILFRTLRSNSIVESMRITSGGNVGIGTSSPNEKLQVLGNIRLTNNNLTTANTLSSEINNYNGSTNQFKSSSIKFLTGTYVDQGHITFNTSISGVDQERVRIAETGNVGIGTTSPSTLFHIYKASFPILTIQSSSYQSSLGIDTTSGNLVLNNESNAPLSFNTNATERMRITSGGNVGIGTTSPAVKLDVNGTGRISSYLDINYQASAANGSLNIDSADPTIRFRVSGGTANKRIYELRAIAAGGTNDRLELRTWNDAQNAASSLLSITNGGNVGIGTTSPAYKFDLNSNAGGISFKTYTSTTNNSEHTYSKDAGFFIDSYQSVGGAPYTKTTDLIANADAGADSQLRMFTATTGGNPTERMRITSGGNVGIGTTSPGGKLHVVGEGIFDDGTNGRLTFANASSQNDIYSTTTSFGGWKNLRLSSNELILSSGGTTERMRITSGGNVGIGTTSPAEILHLQSSQPVIRYTRTGILNWKVGVISGNTFTINNDSTGGDVLNITSGGNVGIGTTSPDQKLTVEGNIRAGGVGNGFLLDTLGVNYTNGMKVVNNYETVMFSGRGSSGYVIAGDNNLRFGFGTNYSAGESMRITSGGNVGIGTTNPNSNGGASARVVHIHGPASGDWAVNHYTNLNTGANADDGTVVGIIGSGRDMYIFNYEDSNVIIGTNSAERMRITSGGNVGIGTTSPNYKLSVLSSNNVSWLEDTSGASGAVFALFSAPGNTGIGSIARVGTTSAIAYNSTSDYRLKEDLKEVNGLDKISKIKIYDFKWKNHTDRMDGVIAHELQEVVPYAVTGEKDAEQMQSVDYSKLVPILVKAIQELKAEIEILKNK